MRMVVQRVQHASVTIEGSLFSSIKDGLMVLVGIEPTDGEEDVEWICSKVARMRLFDDDQGVMNLSLLDLKNKSLLMISQFTLMASTRKGNRPSYIRAARPEHAQPLYERVCTHMETLLGRGITRGVFGADMKVELLNDGPVTIVIDSKLRE